VVERQVENMDIAKATTDQNEQYRIMRLGFIVFLLISPLLPYVFTMMYNSYLFVTLPAQAKALPRFSEVNPSKGNLKQDALSGNCLQLSFRYNTKPPHEITAKRYGDMLVQSGWQKRYESFGFYYYTKGPMHIKMSEWDEADRHKLGLLLTVDTLHVFQLGCLP
jgi:hypothetical protein